MVCLAYSVNSHNAIPYTYTAVQYAKGTKFHLMYRYSAKTHNANLLEDLRHSAYKKQSFIPLVGKGTQSPYAKVHSFILRIM
jgi:hypothetical protein